MLSVCFFEKRYEQGRTHAYGFSKYRREEKRRIHINHGRMSLDTIASPNNTAFPLSMGQQGMWLLHQRYPNDNLYVINFVWYLPEDTHITVLQRAVEALSHRHPALRTTFHEDHGIATQHVHPHLLPLFHVKQIELDNDNAWHAQLQHETRSPFELEYGPPIRWTVFCQQNKPFILLLNIHHLVFDGWSAATLLQNELGMLYIAEREGRSADLAPIHKHYGDFVYEQTRWLKTAAADQARLFWHAQLAGETPELTLPWDHIPTDNRNLGTGASFSFAMDRALQHSFLELAQQLAIRPFSLWLSLWFVLLHRYTGQQDLIVTVPASEREADFKGVCGYFVNMLPIRVAINDDQTFYSLVHVVAQTLKAALQHKRYPFSLLALEKQHAQGKPLTIHPSFEIQDFASFDKPTHSPVTAAGPMNEIWQIGGGLQWERIPFKQQWDEAVLRLRLVKLPEHHYGILEYNCSFFEQPTIERIANHFMTLLHSVTTNPDCPLSKLPLLSNQAWQQIVVQWNATKAAYSHDECIHQLFEEQVLKTPDAIAVSFNDQTLTYAGLNARANQVARQLRTLGVKPDTLVGLYIERSLEMIVGLLGILKAGGAYVPLDPAYPTDRLQFMVQDAALTVLVCHTATRERLSTHTAQIFDLDKDQMLIDAQNITNLTPINKPGHLAYVIYTSGSTGRPKGVMIEHRGLVNVIQTQAKALGIDKRAKVLQFASISFDVAAWETWLSLHTEATLCLATQHHMLPGGPLESTIQRNGITHALLPPILLTSIDPDTFPLLHTLIVGGDSCALDLARKWSHYGRFFNAYGPTEATICVSLKAVYPETTCMTIGRPTANIQLYLLDTYQQPVPIGVAGELYIGGISIARGYLNRPDLTAERFIPNPFSDEPGARLYKTGDLCRYLPNGEIEYVGRLDKQVKLRGFRIELGEIEAVIRQHPDVHDAVVDIHTRHGEKRLVAWVLTPTALNRSALQTHIRQSLPEWMVPAAVVPVTSFPLTPNGKLDRRALPAPDDNTQHETFDAPHGAMETLIAGIWAEVLNIEIEQVGVNQNFFDIGGQSLLVPRVLSRLQQQLNITPNITDFFRYTTIRTLAEHLSQRQTAPAHPHAETVCSTHPEHHDSRRSALSPHQIRRNHIRRGISL